MTAANLDVIESNELTFTLGTYNSIKILKCNHDGFINATLMCNQFKKRFRKIFENRGCKSFYDQFCIEYGCRPNSGDVEYELKQGFLKKLHGTYVHPKLINYIAILASPKYAVDVGKIMDKINELSQVTHQMFEGTTSEIIAQMQTTIDEQTRLIATQRTIIETQETLIQETAVPLDNCNKLLTVIRIGDGYKLSANSSNPQKSFIIRFEFPASMNFKQNFKKRFGPYYYENFDSYTETIQHIRMQGPKSEIVGDQFVPLA
jgi:hypothetical protein